MQMILLPNAPNTFDLSELPTFEIFLTDSQEPD